MAGDEPTNEITRAEAEHAASQVIQLLGSFTALVGPGEDPLKIATLMQRVIRDPERLKRDLVEEILSGGVPRARLIADQRLMTKMLSSPRRILDEVRKDLPKGQLGRPSVLATDAELVARANVLLPLSRAVLKLRAAPTKQPITATIEYLAPDFPEAAPVFAERVARIEQILRDRGLMKARSREGQARVLAYTLAGEACGYSGTYALRQVRTALFRHKKKRT